MTESSVPTLQEQYRQLCADLDALRASVCADRGDRIRDAASPYLRGDGAASDYLGMSDPQGRTFRKWAEKNLLAYSVIGGVRTYRKADIDRMWGKTGYNTRAAA